MLMLTDIKCNEDFDQSLFRMVDVKTCFPHHNCRYVEPKWLHPGAVLENCATLEGGAVFSLIIMFENGT